jgi:hypothetical protein
LFGPAGDVNEQLQEVILGRFTRPKVEEINEHQGIGLICIVENLFQGNYPFFMFKYFLSATYWSVVSALSRVLMAGALPPLLLKRINPQASGAQINFIG